MLHHKKRFGQHFLKDDEALEKTLKLLPQDYKGAIVEVGPGGGALTDKLLPYCEQHGNDFIALEIDEEKVNYLHKNHPESKGQIILEDFLETSLPFEEFLIIGNFPYNISTQIIFKMIQWKDHVPYLIGMFQLEVALRLCSEPKRKTYGITSVITQTFYDTELEFTLPPEAFDPPPKVSSAVIKCIRHHRFDIKNPTRYMSFVKSGFAMRRKTLRNNLKGILNGKQLEDEVFNLRAEALSPKRWVELYKEYRGDV